MDNVETYKIQDLLYIMLDNVKDDSTPSIIARRHHIRQLIAKKIMIEITGVPLIAQYEQLNDYLIFGWLKEIRNSLTNINLKIDHLQEEIKKTMNEVISYLS